MDNFKPVVEAAETDAQRRDIFQFRYKIYVEEMGKQPQEADHQNKLLQDEFDDNALLLMVRNGTDVIATIRFNNFAQNLPDNLAMDYSLDAFNNYPGEALSFTSKLMVDPNWRGTAVVASLIAELYKYARDHHIIFDFINCAPSLVGFYEQIGYRRYCDGFVDDSVGYRVPMVLLIEDITHLRNVRSPLHRLAKNYDNSDQSQKWFKSQFPSHGSFINKRLISEDEFWTILTEKLQQLPIDSIPLLKGLNENKAKAFINSGTVLHFKKDETIIRPGDVGSEMFVILDGVVEVIGKHKHLQMSLAVIGPGQIFGEMAFLTEMPRTAYVIANTDVEVLVLTQSFLHKAMKRMPEVTSYVLFNLSLILSDRLRVSTSHLLDTLD
jgi:predicted GNAT family N-acyltransferase